MNTEVRRLLAEQDGVISRAQALAAGMAAHDVRRLVRRREWVRCLPGVYVAHTGPMTWWQRAWAAVLFAAPAALQGTSALRAADGPGRRAHDDDGPVHVAIDQGRSLVSPSGVVVHRRRGFDRVVQWNCSPPRTRIEEAVLDVAVAARDELAAVAVLADAVQARRTTPERLRRALDLRARVGRRAFLVAVLDDVRAGACSVLERAYLRDVERAHGLPRARRQAEAVSRGRILRDVAYERFQLVVELDGRLGHTSTSERDRDLDRDLDAAVTAGAITLRLGYGQVLGRPCRTAARIAALLARGGWTAQLSPCPSCSARANRVA